MIHAELVKHLADATNLTQVKIDEVLTELSEVTKKVLKKEGKMKIKGIAKFEVKSYEARMGFNPKTKEKIKIDAKKKVKATSAKELDV